MDIISIPLFFLLLLYKSRNNEQINAQGDALEGVLEEPRNSFEKWQDNHGKGNLGIIGGSKATLREFPFQVSITVNGAICGGIIYKENWIITAAHCLYNSQGNKVNNADILIRAGSLNRKTGGVWAMVASFIIHPNYKRLPGDADIALIKLRSPLTLSQTVQIAKLAQETNIPSGKCFISGWGRTKEGEGSESEVLLKGTVSIRRASDCENAKDKINPRTMICAGDEGKSICNGDSGGPLICEVNGEKVVFGMAGYASKKLDCTHQPGVFLLLGAQKEFLKKAE